MMIMLIIVSLGSVDNYFPPYTLLQGIDCELNVLDFFSKDLNAIHYCEAATVLILERNVKIIRNKDRIETPHPLACVQIFRLWIIASHPDPAQK